MTGKKWMVKYSLRPSPGHKGAVKKCMNDTDITPPPVISTKALRSGEISLRNVASPRVAGDLSALRFIRAQNLCPIPAGSPARDDDASGQLTVIY